MSLFVICYNAFRSTWSFSGNKKKYIYKFFWGVYYIVNFCKKKGEIRFFTQRLEIYKVKYY